MKQVLECKLTFKDEVGKNGKVYHNLYLTTPKGTSVQILVDYHDKKIANKLHYKLFKEVEEC